MSSYISLIKDVDFDKTHYYNEKKWKYQKFANDNWYKKNDELFVDFFDILDINKLISNLNTIFHSNFKEQLFFNELFSLSHFSDILDSIKDKENSKKNDLFLKVSTKKKKKNGFVCTLIREIGN